MEKKVAARPRPAVASSGGNWALEFDGKSSYVETPLKYDGDASDLTIEAIVTPNRQIRTETLWSTVRDLRGLYLTAESALHGTSVLAVRVGTIHSRI